MRAHPGARGGKAAARRGRSGRSGYTLAEILISLFIFSAIIGSILLSYIGFQKSFKVVDSYLTIRKIIRDRPDTMVRDIREAIEPLAEHSFCDSRTMICTTKIYCPGNLPRACLVLKVPSIHPKDAPIPTPAGEVINIGTTFDYIAFFRSGNTLSKIFEKYDSRLDERTCSTRVIATNVTSLKFTFFDRDNDAVTWVSGPPPKELRAVQIDLEASSKETAKAYAPTSERFITTVTFRNAAARQTPTPTP